MSGLARFSDFRPCIMMVRNGCFVVATTIILDAIDGRSSSDCVYFCAGMMLFEQSTSWMVTDMITLFYV